MELNRDMGKNSGVVRKTIVSCSINVGVGLLSLGGLIGFIAVIPTIAEWGGRIWEHYAWIVTDGGSSVTPAAYIQWAALLVAVWSLCVAIKLVRLESIWCAPFAGLTMVSVMLGVIPSQYAIMDVCGEWSRSFVTEQPFVVQTAVAVATLLPCIGFLIFVCFLVWGMSLADSATTETEPES
jgi:hypothetical protein